MANPTACEGFALGLANDLHTYNKHYAEQTKPLSDLLKKDIEWIWLKEQEDAFTSVKQSLVEAPILALPDADKPFSVVCDASNFATGSALIQKDDDSVDRVISYQSRLLKAAELNYPVHDGELLSIKYAHRIKYEYRTICDLYGSRITEDRNKLTAPLA